MQFPDRRDLVRAAGYGVPEIHRASHSYRGRPTILVEDALRPAIPVEARRHEREVHLIRLPLPDEALLALGEQEIEVSVTLSFFIEPNEANRSRYAGAMLRWDIQREAENEDAFHRRINKLQRHPGYSDEARAYPWEIGPDVRSRGSVQSDRCRTTAAWLAGGKTVAVFPVLGWWDGHSKRTDAVVPYSLAITLDAGTADIDLYAAIETAIAVRIEV
jgi:hypothetical protein